MLVLTKNNYNKFKAKHENRYWKKSLSIANILYLC